MTRSAPESPGRGCPIVTDGKNSMPHTAYYPTVESLVESQIGTSNADESVQAFGEKITTVIEYTPTQKQLPWHDTLLVLEEDMPPAVISSGSTFSAFHGGCTSTKGRKPNPNDKRSQPPVNRSAS
jgi:hypothetical protein